MKSQLSRVFVVSLIAASVASPVLTQDRESTNTNVLSPAVMATWITHSAGADPPTLTLLVLWRGTPGWFMKGKNNESSGGDPSGRITVQLSRGSVDLKLVFDGQAQTATIQGNKIPLRGANVLLVDRVDSTDGPQVFGTRTVDSKFTESPPRIEPILQSSKELLDFLQCAAKLPDPKIQAVMDLICARVMGGRRAE